MIDEGVFQELRRQEFRFFIDTLEKLGKQGLRPHQAYYALCAMEGVKPEEDKFYWEGVFTQEFTREEKRNAIREKIDTSNY